ncbi:hypothetical protein NDU88_001291 [Pleurodeles waltl]|uniref:Uncharacterized protein n=1 Tax=Pleurodeles waltl TaxID=8319 RepID=A0AAV7LXH3_PLEWA|nr:hypothetical protein NDU88_001291 [Pleurodeles waltl]
MTCNCRQEAIPTIFMYYSRVGVNQLPYQEDGLLQNAGRGQATKHGGRKPLELRAASVIFASTRGEWGGTPLPSGSDWSLEDSEVRKSRECAPSGLRQPRCTAAARHASEVWPAERQGRRRRPTEEEQRCGRGTEWPGKERRPAAVELRRGRAGPA